MESPVTEDYYATLQVSQFDSLATIRESYRRLALRFHPDKNTDQDATAAFQRISRAWDVLKEEETREEYNVEYWKMRKRSWEGREAEEMAASVKRRRQEVDREAMKVWMCPNEDALFEEGERRVKAVVWKVRTRKEFLARLDAWNEFCKKQKEDVEKLQASIAKLGSEFTKSEVARDGSGTRQSKPSKNEERPLQQHITTETLKAQELIQQLLKQRQLFEEQDHMIRAKTIQEALDLLGPRNLNPPLFSTIDRRGQCINYWRALSRIKPPSPSPPTFPPHSPTITTEGPFHNNSIWERIDGEHNCARCNSSTFHILPEYRPAKCSSCGMVVCNDCFRELKLLTQFKSWICEEKEIMHSLFSLEAVFSGTGPVIGGGRVYKSYPGAEGAPVMGMAYWM